MRTSSEWDWSVLRVPPWRFLLSGTPWRGTLYVAITAAVGLIAATPVIATWFAAPFWGMALAKFERWRPVLIGLGRIPDPRQNDRPIRSATSRWLRDPITWAELAYLLIFIAFAAASFFMMVLLLAILAVVVHAATGIQAPSGNVVGAWVEDLPVPTAAMLPVAMALFVCGLYVATALSVAQMTTARAVLSGRAEQLERQVEELTFSRRALLDGFDAERRRIERDLHDGAQQHLTILSVNVALLGLELDLLEREPSDWRPARQAFEKIGRSADAAIQSLRASVRGIHPQVLVDHGLEAAVRELLSRSPLSADIRMDLPERPSKRIETAAYFVISEALTNALKHGGAQSVAVRAGTEGGFFWAEVRDDGTGGADVRQGTGLRGLVDRAVALGGTLTYDSPQGGPTIIRFAVPREVDLRR